MSPDTKLADAASPSAYGTCPEGYSLPLRASTSAQTSSGSLRKVGGSTDVAARVSFLEEGARARHGMPSLPAGCEVRAGTYTYPENFIEDGNRPAGSSYFTYRFKARRTTSVTVSPRSAALACAAFQTSSAMRTERTGVFGWSGMSDGRHAVRRVADAEVPCAEFAELELADCAESSEAECVADGVEVLGGEGVGVVGVGVDGECGLHGVRSRLVYGHHNRCMDTRQGVDA